MPSIYFPGPTFRTPIALNLPKHFIAVHLGCVLVFSVDQSGEFIVRRAYYGTEQIIAEILLEANEHMDDLNLLWEQNQI